MLRLGGLMLALGLGPAQALADGVLPGRITKADQVRLEALAATRAQALEAARKAGGGASLGEVEALLERPAQPLRGEFDAAGDWNCRRLSIDAGGTVTREPWSGCRVDDDGAGWRLESLEGARRTSGYFYDLTETQMVYLGVRSSPGEPAVAYGADAARDEAALASSPGPESLRLEFPAPAAGARLEVLELVRPGEKLAAADGEGAAAAPDTGTGPSSGLDDAPDLGGAWEFDQGGGRSGGCLVVLEPDSSARAGRLARAPDCEQRFGFLGKAPGWRMGASDTLEFIDAQDQSVLTFRQESASLWRGTLGADGSAWQLQRLE